MGCIACFRAKNQGSKPLKRNECVHGSRSQISPPKKLNKLLSEKAKTKISSENSKDSSHDVSSPIAAQTFTFSELALATNNFRKGCQIGEGGFGRVYKGQLESTGQVVAIKKLDRDGQQGNREFLVEVLMLSLLHHPNLVSLIGYCADGDQRLLVYEFMPLGCLEDHLHYLARDKEPLDWTTRMKIAAGSAHGLEYLHDKANPPVIYRDFKSSNILLDEAFHPKLSDFGLAKLGPVGDQTHVSTRVMGTYGYCAPEYAMTGQLTVKSDVYSFGVVLLELITGRKAIDNSKPAGERNLVSWARPLFKDRLRHPQMADPLLNGQVSGRGLYQALAVAAMCLQEDATARPAIGDVVTALNFLASQPLGSTLANSKPMTPREKRNKKAGNGSNGKFSITSSPGKTGTVARSQCKGPRSADHVSRDIYSKDGRCGHAEAMDADFVRKTDSYGLKQRDTIVNREVSEKSDTREEDHPSGSLFERGKGVVEAKIWGECHRDRKRGDMNWETDGCSNSD